VRYQFIQSLAGQFPIAALCRALQVAKSGYYAWCKRQPSVRQREEETITGRIREHFEASRQTYGSPRILRELRAEGIVCGKHRVARLMRGAGLRALQPRRFMVTTDSKHVLPVADNRLNQDFTASRVDERWAADITYVWTGEGWLYLAVVLDLFSRRIVGWSMQASLHKQLVIDALTMALRLRRPDPGLLHHSDRGSQYASADFQEALGDAGIVCSMSRKGNCWDNAVVESFFGTLKVELVHRCRFATRQQARQEVFEYIEVWYNRSRRHSTLGYLSPAQFERLHRPGAVSALNFTTSRAA
jgi:putative transposase